MLRGGLSHKHKSGVGTFLTKFKRLHLVFQHKIILYSEKIKRIGSAFVFYEQQVHVFRRKLLFPRMAI